MSKQVKLTERLKNLIRRASDNEDMDFSQISVYESVAASTRPISQRATAYNGAVMSESFLLEMAAYLETETVPMLIMHEGQMLPIGKVFYSEVLDADNGYKDLNTLFYVMADDELSKKIDLGIIDEVSVGALPKHAYCSQCDFDYMEQGNEMNFYFRECDEGHELGVDGTHLRLTALDSWKELSLVGKGASDKPKIVGSTKQRLGKERYESLAANSTSPMGVEMAYLLCSATPSENNDDIGSDMNLKDITDQVATLSADKAKVEVKLDAADAALTEAKTQVAALQDEVKELNVKLSSGSDSALAEEVAKLKEANEAQAKVMEFFDQEVKRASVAASLELSEEASLEDKINLMKEAQVVLSAIPRGGVTDPAESVVDKTNSLALAQRNSAFLTNS